MILQPFEIHSPRTAKVIFEYNLPPFKFTCLKNQFVLFKFGALKTDLSSFKLSGAEIDEAAVLRAIELSALRYCPAQAMLGKVFPMQLVYYIYAADGTLIKQGEYQLPE